MNTALPVIIVDDINRTDIMIQKDGDERDDAYKSYEKIVRNFCILNKVIVLLYADFSSFGGCDAFLP